MTDIVERLRDHDRHVRGRLIEGLPDLCIDDMVEAADEIERQAAELRSLRAVLRCAETILSNMAEENNSMFNRWPIHHEPLRADARNLLPQIRAALGEGKE